MEHLDLPAHRIPFELLDGVFARLDRQVGEELPFDFLPILRRLLFLGMDDCQSQSWVSLLLANGRKDPNLRYRFSRMASSRSPLSSRTSMRCSPFTEVTSISSATV